MNATIYHNPRCSKSRETLAILRAAGIEPRIVEYLKVPPTVAELERLYARAGITPREGLRRGEPDAAMLRDAEGSAILEAMAINPVLIERPLVETEAGVRLCRPPERVREIL